MEVVDNTEMRHFEARDEDQLAIIEYQIQERKIFLTRVEFPPNFEESGKAETMIEKTLDLIDEKGMRVVPMKRVLKQHFKKHPGRRKMLPVGIHL
ncbi:MAG: N-acetyltransferase [Owenweeksia sp.]